jgi:hypothetical protein
MRRELTIAVVALAVGLGGYAFWELVKGERAESEDEALPAPLPRPRKEARAPAAPARPRPTPSRPPAWPEPSRPSAPSVEPSEDGPTDGDRSPEPEGDRERRVRERLWRELEALEEPTVDEGARLIHEAMQELERGAGERRPESAEDATGATGQ